MSYYFVKHGKLKPWYFYRVVLGYIPSSFCRYSETNSFEFLENLEEMFPQYNMHIVIYVTNSVIHPHNSMLHISKEL